MPTLVSETTELSGPANALRKLPTYITAIRSNIIANAALTIQAVAKLRSTETMGTYSA